MDLFGEDEIRKKKVDQLSSGVDRLGEVIALDGIPADIKRDSTIQRFEFCYEMAWKTLKAFLEWEGTITTSPRETLRSAFSSGLLGSEVQLWERMLADRNVTSHTYNESVAQRIADNISAVYHKVLVELVDRLRDKL